MAPTIAGEHLAPPCFSLCTASGEDSGAWKILEMRRCRSSELNLFGALGKNPQNAACAAAHKFSFKEVSI
jgi:hypothetical protein